MSEKYISVQSFKYGLDARRDELSNVLGTLVAVQNAFINSGGEVEQRMSFVKDGTPFPTNCFGLQDTDQGLVTFGADAAPNGTLPTGITYQQLVAPAGVGLELPPGNQIASIVYSTNYLGKAFVIVFFADALSFFAYYNGVLVGPTRNGLVLVGNAGGNPETVSQLAQDFADQINAITGWVAVPNFAFIGGNRVATPGAVIVKSPSGVHFSPTVTVDTAAGQLSGTLVDQNIDSVAASSASTIFTINAGGAGDTIKITAPAKADGTGTVQLTGGAMPFHTSLAQTAADIVSTINLLSGSTGYTALRTGSVITVYAPAQFGNFTFNLTIVTTGTMTTIAGGGGTSAFKISLTNSGLFPTGGNARTLTVSNSPILVGVTVTAGHTGAAGLVTYAWSEVDSQGNPAANLSGITMSTVTGSSVFFSAVVTPGAASQSGNAAFGHFLVVANDAGSGTTSKLFFTVALQVIAFGG